MNHFYFTTFEELLEDKNFHNSWKAIAGYHGEDFDDDAIFIVSDGDVHFQDHFRLDIDLGWTTIDKSWLNQFSGLEVQKSDRRVEGLIVFGQLTVAGSILNEEGDYGAFLYVSGQVSAQSLLAGGSVIYMGNDINLEEVFLSHYNHGYLYCDAVLNAPVVIINDHYTNLKEYKASLFYYNDKTGECPPENHCYENEEEDWLCSGNLLKLLDNPTPTFEDLMFDLNEGEYVLTEASGLAHKNEDYWQRKVIKHWSNMRRIPVEFKTKQLFEKAYAKHGAICFSYFPEAYISQEQVQQSIEKTGVNLRYIPESLLTKELCLVAAKHKTYLSIIPNRFLDERLIRAVILNNESQMKDVPSEFITEELLIDYVKLGPGLWLDKYCALADVSKNTVLFKALDSGIATINEIWGYHFHETVYAYANKLYNNEEHKVQWNHFQEKFHKKISRLPKY